MNGLTIKAQKCGARARPSTSCAHFRFMFSVSFPMWHRVFISFIAYYCYYCKQYTYTLSSECLFSSGAHPLTYVWLPLHACVWAHTFETLLLEHRCCSQHVEMWHLFIPNKKQERRITIVLIAVGMRFVHFWLFYCSSHQRDKCVLTSTCSSSRTHTHTCTLAISRKM